MIGSIVLRDSELVGIAGESDDLRTTSEQLGVLNGIPAESTDTQNPDHPTRAERASIAKVFHATEGCHTCIGERREFLEFQTTVRLDQIASRDGDELCKTSHRSESGPTHVGTNVRIADQAMAADAIAPSGRDNHVVSLLKSRHFGHDPTDLVYDAGNLVTQRDRRRNVGIFPEIPVHELHVGAAHSARLDLDENFIGLNVRNRHVLEDRGFAVLRHACCFHICSTFIVGLRFTGRLRLVTKCSDSCLCNRNVLFNGAGTCPDCTDDGPVQNDGYSAAEDDDLSHVAFLNTEKWLSRLRESREVRGRLSKILAVAALSMAGSMLPMSEPVLKLVTGFPSDLRGKEAPRVRNALEFVLAALAERDAGAHDEILDRAGDQDFVGTRQGTDTSGDVDGETGEIVAADFALSRVQARSHIDPEGLGGFGDGLGAMNGARRAV